MIYRALFQRDVRVIRPRINLANRITQATDRSNSKSSLVIRVYADPEGRADTEVELTKRAYELIGQIERIKEVGKYKNPVIICPMALKEQLGAQAHFYGSRGTNMFENADAIVIAGTPLSPLKQIEEMAATIWFDRMEKFDNRWVVIEKQYNYSDENGMGWTIPINQYVDPHLNAVLYQQREAEIIQCAHRGRIIYRDCPVFLLTNLPVDDLPPTELITIRQLMGAPEEVDVFKWQSALDFATMMAKEKGSVTRADMIHGLDIDTKTATKYMNKLEESFGWVKAWSPPTAGTGRPPRAISMPESEEE